MFMILAVWFVAVGAFQLAPPQSSSRVAFPKLAFPKRGVVLEAKKKKNKRREEDFVDAATRQYAFTLAGLTKKTPDGRTLFEKLDLAFFHGAKIGICGKNGAGKSTLLKLMAGIDKEFEGIAKPGAGLKVGYLPQEPKLDGETVEDAISGALKDAKDTLQRFDDISAELANPDADTDALMAELTLVQDKIDAGNLWDLDRRVAVTMDALRCPPMDARTEYLSGGEQRRVAFAALILENNDMLLLDECTNHLDVETIAWVEAFLQDFPGTVVLITHDRYFLERITKWILELDGSGKGLPFEGSYAQWLQHKADGLASKKSPQATTQLDSFLAELRAFQDRADRADDDDDDDSRPQKQRLTAYESLLQQEVPRDAPGTLFIPPGPRLGTDVIKVDAISKNYGDRTLFSDLSFDIPRGAIVGIVGPNGAGKSTLIKALTKELDPSSGSIDIGSTVVLATGAQTREALDARGTDASVVEAVCDGMDYVDLGSRQVPARQYISWYGFTGSAQQKPVSALSGGERNRAFLARQLRANANCIILDEPTNDLDVSTLRALEDALLAFAGTAIVVSHDRFFLDRLATHILAFEVQPDDPGAPCSVVFFQGNYAEYEQDRRRRLGDTVPKALRFNRNQLATTA